MRECIAQFWNLFLFMFVYLYSGSPRRRRGGSRQSWPRGTWPSRGREQPRPPTFRHWRSTSGPCPPPTVRSRSWGGWRSLQLHEGFHESELRMWWWVPSWRRQENCTLEVNVCPDEFNCSPPGHSQTVDEVVYTVCSKIKIADDFLFFIAFIVILRLTVLSGLKYFFQNQKCEDST